MLLPSLSSASAGEVSERERESNTFVTLVTRRIDQRFPVVEQWVAGDGCASGPPIIRDRVLGLGLSRRMSMRKVFGRSR